MSCTKSQKDLRVDAVLGHQPAQRRAVALIIMLLQRAQRHGRRGRTSCGQEQRDARVDLGPEIAAGRIERVVEIEDPGVDIGEGGARFRRGVALLGRRRMRLKQAASRRSPRDQRARAVIGQQLDQHRMRAACRRE